MSLAGEKVLLRIYLESADRSPHTPTYERIAKLARSEGLAGATVLKGIMGLGSQGILKSSIWSAVEHLPVIVEIVDSPDRIGPFLNKIVSPLMINGMVTLERAYVMMYRWEIDQAPPPLQLGPQVQPLANLPKIEPRDHMTINETGVLLRIFIGESDRFENKPLHEAIVQKTREMGLAGATVLRGVEGFGANSVVHKAKVLAMSTDLPIVIEIVDSQEKIQPLLPHLQTMVKEGMITMEYVHIALYRHNPAGTLPAT